MLGISLGKLWSAREAKSLVSVWAFTKVSRGTQCSSSTEEVKATFPWVCFQSGGEGGSVAIGASQNNEAVEGCKRQQSGLKNEKAESDQIK